MTRLALRFSALLLAPTAALLLAAPSSVWPAAPFQVELTSAPDAAGRPTVVARANADWRGTATIRNAAGRLVRTLYVAPARVVKGGQALELTWDGADDDGLLVPDGEYTVRVEALKAEPDHTMGDRWFVDHYLAIMLDPRGDCFYLAGINSRETLFTHDEYPEAVMRRFDFDGLPLGPEIPLEAVQLEWGTMRPTMDIRGDVYLVDGFQNVASALPRLYKVDGRTGRLLWTSWGIIDNATGRQRAVDGTLFDGRKIGLNAHAHLWDTHTTLWVGSMLSDDEISRIDARTGTLLKRIKVPVDERYASYPRADTLMTQTAMPSSIRVAPDGTIATNSSTSPDPLVKLTPEGKALWQLQAQDLNEDGDLLDPPDARTGWGEVCMAATSDVGPMGIDVEGNIYGTAPVDRTQRLNNGIVKYDLNGQILMWVEICTPPRLFSELEISADGKQIAANFKHDMRPMLSQADFATTTVRLTGSPAKPTVAFRSAKVASAGEGDTGLSVESRAFRSAKGDRWRADMAERLGDGPAGELNRGRLALARKQFADAAACLGKAAAADDPAISAVAYFLGAEVHRRQGKPAEAIGVYRQCAARWRSERARALIQAAQCQIGAGGTEEALRTLEEAQQSDAEGFWAGKAAVMRVVCLRTLNRNEAAVALARQCRDQYPLVRPNLLIEEGESLLALDRAKEAAEVLVEVVRHYPIWTIPLRGARQRRAMTLLTQAIKAAKLAVAEPAPYTPQPGKPGDYWPDVVLGQETLDDGWYMHSEGGSAKGKGFRYVLYPRTIAWPLGLWSDGSRLVVAGYNAGRICVFEPVPEADFAPTTWRVGERSGWDYMTLPGGMATPGGVMRPPLHRSYSLSVRTKQEKEKKTADMTMNPVAVCSDGKAFFVTDSIGHRVLVYNELPRRPDTVADLVLGQPNLLDGVPNHGGLSASSLTYPYGAHCDGRYLWVADRGNHRVLRWTLPIREHFQKADLVVGQKDLNSAERNAKGLSAAGLNRPGWVYSDGQRLVVADSGNHRVLIWNRVPTANGQPADVVLGQKDFETSFGWNLLASGYIGCESMAFPTGLLVDEGKLYVCDSSNNRVLVWNKIPAQNGQPADVVIGQPDLDSRWVPIPPQTWYSGYLPEFQRRTTGNLYFPIAMAADTKNLYLSDYNRCRILIYKKQPR